MLAEVATTMSLVSVSLSIDLYNELKERQERDPRFGWKAIFMRGYRAALSDEADLPGIKEKIEKLSQKLNFYAQKSFQLEQELCTMKAERGR